MNAAALVVRGPEVRLGSSAASDFVALSSLVDGLLTALSNTFSGWVVVTNDGGAASKGKAE